VDPEYAAAGRHEPVEATLCGLAAGARRAGRRVHHQHVHSAQITQAAWNVFGDLNLVTQSAEDR
jgi:hypothetical protein